MIAAADSQCALVEGTVKRLPSKRSFLGSTFRALRRLCGAAARMEGNTKSLGNSWVTPCYGYAP